MSATCGIFHFNWKDYFYEKELSESTDERHFLLLEIHSSEWEIEEKWFSFAGNQAQKNI